MVGSAGRARCPGAFVVKGFQANEGIDVAFFRSAGTARGVEAGKLFDEGGCSVWKVRGEGLSCSFGALRACPFTDAKSDDDEGQIVVFDRIGCFCR